MGDPFAGAPVVGIGLAAFTRQSGRRTRALTVEAAGDAVADAGPSPGGGLTVVVWAPA